jgi:pimeloyl-ACP methyl ester carboxylesterase
MLVKAWNDPRIGFALAIGFAVLAGLIIGLMMPRGPAAGWQALFIMAVSLAAGLGAGFATRSTWAILLAPAVNVIVIELFHTGLAGPTVGAIRLDEPFGILALILTRGFYALIGLLPMALGAGIGVLLGRRLSGTCVPAKGSVARLGRAVSTVLAFAVAVFLVVLAVLIMLPASTPPIVGADGKQVPGSVTELTTIKVNGNDQALLIRGHSADNPVLLYLAGGPGQSDLAYPRALFGELEKNFTIVCWDGRGRGKSYGGFEPSSTITFENDVADTIAVTDYLRERFDEDKIYLIGESYGSFLGVRTVQQRPDLYYAYIGSGQMVSPGETDRRLYNDVLALANRTGDEAMAAKMRSYGEPPYKDVYAYTYVMNLYDALGEEFTPPAKYIELVRQSGVNPLGVMASEYTLVEKLNVLRGLFDVYSVMWPRMQEIDFRKDAAKLDVPVYVFDAKYELSARRDLALEWYGMLDAPKKRIYTMENAGHAAAFEGVEEFTRIMNEVVLPETYPGS